MKFKMECPLCKSKFTLPFGPKVNEILSQTINNKYPEETKQRKAEVIGDNNFNMPKIIECPLLTKKAFHMIPEQRITIKLDIEEAKTVIRIGHSTNLFAFLTDYPIGSCGCLVMIIGAPTTQSRITLLHCKARVQLKEIKNRGTSYDIGVFEVIDDDIPSDIEIQKKIIELGNELYDNFKSMQQKLPESFIESMKSKGYTEPLLLDENLKCKLSYAKKISLYIASNINAEKLDSRILYTTDTLERLNWCKNRMKDAKDLIVLFGGESESKMLFQILTFFILFIAILLAVRYFK